MNNKILENEKILALGKNAKIKYDLMLYVEMEALLSNEKTKYFAKAWYMEKYTQLYCMKFNRIIKGKGLFYKNAHISQPKNPFINEKITSSFFYKPTSIINFIIKEISNGCYIKIVLDHFYLPNYKFYNNKHILHTEFIYGYNLKKRVFYVIGSSNLRMGGFTRTEVSFDNFIHSYKSVKKTHPFRVITILGINERKEYCFNIKKLTKGLLSYYKAKPQLLNEICALNDKHSFFKVYGLNTYSEMKKLLKYEFSVSNQRILSSIKYLQALADYKKLMLQRIEFLYANNFVDENEFEFLYNSYAEIVKGFNIIINLYIKNYISSKDIIKCNIVDRLDELEIKEKKIIFELILCLKYHQTIRTHDSV